MTADRQRRLVADMLRYSDEIAAIVRRGREEFFDRGDLRNRTTVEHFLEFLGEASGAVGQSFRSENPGLPWPALQRFRFDRAHPYDDDANPVNYDEVWRFAVNDLPRIVRQLRKARVPDSRPARRPS